MSLQVNKSILTYGLSQLHRTGQIYGDGITGSPKEGVFCNPVTIYLLLIFWG